MRSCLNPHTEPRSRLFADDAAAALPSDLNNFVVFDQHGHSSLPAGKRAHPAASLNVRFHVILHKMVAAPFQPLAHLPRLLASGCSEKFQLSHGREPPSFRESRGRRTLALPEFAG